MPPSFLTNLSKAHGIPPETMQAALLSLAAAIGDPPAPVEEAPAPVPTHYLPLPAFNSTIEETQAEFYARYAADERERRIVHEHNKAEMRRFNKENDAYVAYRSYIQAAREFEEARAAQLPIHIQAAQNWAENVKRAAIVDSPPPPQESNLLNSAENVQNKKRAAIVESPAPPQDHISVPDNTLPRSRSESHLTVTAAGPEPNPLDGIQDAVTDMAAEISNLRDAFRQNQQPLKDMLQLLRQLVDKVSEFGARFVELEEHRLELLGRIVAAMEQPAAT